MSDGDDWHGGRHYGPSDPSTPKSSRRHGAPAWLQAAGLGGAQDSADGGPYADGRAASPESVTWNESAGLRLGLWVSGAVFGAEQAPLEEHLESGDGDDIGPGGAVEEVVEGLVADRGFLGDAVAGPLPLWA